MRRGDERGREKIRGENRLEKRAMRRKLSGVQQSKKN